MLYPQSPSLIYLLTHDMDEEATTLEFMRAVLSTSGSPIVSISYPTSHPNLNLPFRNSRIFQSPESSLYYPYRQKYSGLGKGLNSWKKKQIKLKPLNNEKVLHRI